MSPALQRETGLQGHLRVVGIAVVADGAAKPGHFEPAQVAQRGAGAADGWLDRIVASLFDIPTSSTTLETWSGMALSSGCLQPS